VIDVGADARDPQGRPGLLTPEAIDRLVEGIHARSGGESRQATGAAASNLDLYQVNCTFYDALGRRDDEYLIARAIQFFAPGIPQVYYAGLFAETNDMELLARTGVGRDINRHYYTAGEVREHLQRPVVRRLLDLIRFRNLHPAFNGKFEVVPSADDRLVLVWREGVEWAQLTIDLPSLTAEISCSTPEAKHTISVTSTDTGSMAAIKGESR
jgi:sucrose phosphorylase